MKKHFRDHLHQFINDNHLNVASIARDMNFDSAKLNAIIKGKRGMDVEEFIKFCEATHVTPDTIVFYNPKQSKAVLK